MSGFKYQKIDEIPVRHKTPHPDYEYYKRTFVPRSSGTKTLVNIYEIPPLKSAYPYHYHLKDEETFFILSGEGKLRTPEGERAVSAGDLLFFPPNPAGAHKLTNTSATEKLVYIDFDIVHDLDVAVYPDSGKIGIWGKNINQLFESDSNVNYYKGE